MPTRTFLNLPKEKQELLLQAAKREFERVPLQEASINRIIAEAKIPRGSFYMYFEDKEDLYFYTIDYLIRFMFEKIQRCLKEEKGDLLEAYRKYFDQMLDYASKPEHRSFFQNLVISATPASKHLFLEKNKIARENFGRMLELIDYDLISITEEEASELIDFISAAMMRNLMKYFAGRQTKEQARLHVQFILSTLRKGLYQRKENEEC